MIAAGRYDRLDEPEVGILLLVERAQADLERQRTQLRELIVGLSHAVGDGPHALGDSPGGAHRLATSDWRATLSSSSLALDSYATLLSQRQEAVLGLVEQALERSAPPPGTTQPGTTQPGTTAPHDDPATDRSARRLQASRVLLVIGALLIVVALFLAVL